MFSQWSNSYKDDGSLQYAPWFETKIFPIINNIPDLISSLALYYLDNISKTSIADFNDFDMD
jgi:hypothetical protein